LAAELHGLWTKGREDESLRIIVADDPEIVAARLALIEAARLVIASGLGVMGVQPVEELH
jgi:arginyl-tRNA synthetase